MLEQNKPLVAQLLVKKELKLTAILNSLEIICVAIIQNVADEDVVYHPAKKVFCEFVRREHLMISYSRYKGAPYKNLVELYLKWSKRMDTEDRDKEISQLIEKNDRIKKNNNINPGTPIGT